MSDLAEICTRGSIQGEENSVSKFFGKFKFLRELHVTKVCTFFQFLPNLDPILLYEGGQNRKNQTSLWRKFSHRAIQILKNQGPISSQFFRKNTITFCSILAIFCQKERRGHTLKGRNQNLIYPIAVSEFMGMFLCKMFCTRIPNFAAITTKGCFFF